MWTRYQRKQNLLVISDVVTKAFHGPELASHPPIPLLLSEDLVLDMGAIGSGYMRCDARPCLQVTMHVS